MNIDIIEPVSQAIQTVRRILFSPFNLVKWCGMGFTALLGVDLISSTSCSGPPGGGGPGNSLENDPENGSRIADLIAKAEAHWVLIALVGGAILAIWISVMLLILWINSRGRFMFIDNVVRDAGEIREPWRRLRPLGNSLFRFMLALFVTGCVCLLALILVSVLVAIPDIQRNSFGINAVGAIALGSLGLILLLLAWGVIATMTEDFVAPIMYATNTGALQAWQEYLTLLKPNKGGFALYVLFRWVLGLGIGMLELLMCAVTCCVVLLPFVGTVLRLPLLVFMRAYPLHILEQFGDRYRLLPAPWPVSTEPQVPGQTSNAPEST